MMHCRGENTDLAADVSVVDQATENMPSAARPEHPRDESNEKCAEIGRQHRDGVQEGAAFSLHSGLVYARPEHPLAVARGSSSYPSVVLTDLAVPFSGELSLTRHD